MKSNWPLPKESPSFIEGKNSRFSRQISAYFQGKTSIWHPPYGLSKILKNRSKSPQTLPLSPKTIR